MNIKEAATKFDLTADTLRYYERIGVMPPVTRNQSGYRDYQVRDLNWIYLVKKLRDAGLTIESLIEFATLAQMDRTKDVQDAQKTILNDQLEAIDQKIKDLTDTRELLNFKIETYDEHLALFADGKTMPDPMWKEKS